VNAAVLGDLPIADGAVALMADRLYGDLQGAWCGRRSAALAVDAARITPAAKAAAAVLSFVEGPFIAPPW
jgi:hypothetical protein